MWAHSLPGQRFWFYLPEDVGHRWNPLPCKIYAGAWRRAGMNDFTWTACFGSGCPWMHVFMRTTLGPYCVLVALAGPVLCSRALLAGEAHPADPPWALHKAGVLSEHGVLEVGGEPCNHPPGFVKVHIGVPAGTTPASRTHTHTHLTHLTTHVLGAKSASN